MKPNTLYNSLIYSLLTLLQPLSSLLLFPIYLSYLSIEEYGVLVLVTNVNIFITLIVGFGIGNAVHSFYFNYYHDHIQLKKYIATILNFCVVCSLGLIILLLLAGPFLFRFIFSSNDLTFYPFGILSVITGCLSAISAPYLILLKNSRNIRIFFTLTILSIVLTVGLQLFFLMQMNLKVVGLLWARLIAALIPVLVIYLVFIRQFIFTINKRLLLPSYHFSIRYLPTSIIAWINSYIDRFIIERLLDLQTLGIYGILITISSMIEMFYLSIVSAIQPIIFSVFAEKKTEKTILNRVLRFYFHFVLLGFSALTCFVFNIHYFFTINYIEDIYPYFVMVSAGYFISSYTYIFLMTIFYFKKTKITFFVQFSSAVIIIFLDILLIPILGIQGAVLAGFTTKVILAIGCYFLSQKVYKIKYDYEVLMVFPLTIIGFILVGSFLCNRDIMSYPFFGIIQFIVILLLLLIMNKKLIKNQLFKL